MIFKNCLGLCFAGMNSGMHMWLRVRLWGPQPLAHCVVVVVVIPKHIQIIDIKLFDYKSNHCYLLVIFYTSVSQPVCRKLILVVPPKLHNLHITTYIISRNFLILFVKCSSFLNVLNFFSFKFMA